MALHGDLDYAKNDQDQGVKDRIGDFGLGNAAYPGL